MIVCGDGAVGKTTLIHRYIANKFKKSYTATIGVDILSKSVEVNRDGTPFTVELNFWDMAGQEHFKLIRTKFYKQASSALLIFDVTSQKSFDTLENWIEESRNGIGHDIPYVMIGNKIDLGDKRVISKEQMQDMAKKLGIHLELIIETSALSGEGVEQAFNHLANSIIDYHLSK